jgi:hypothetical protein
MLLVQQLLLSMSHSIGFSVMRLGPKLFHRLLHHISQEGLVDAFGVASGS